MKKERASASSEPPALTLSRWLQGPKGFRDDWIDAIGFLRVSSLLFPKDEEVQGQSHSTRSGISSPYSPFPLSSLCPLPFTYEIPE